MEECLHTYFPRIRCQHEPDKGPEVSGQLSRRLTWLLVLSALCVSTTRAAAQTGAADGQWRSYGGDQGHTKYAPLDQINQENVQDLRITWTWTSLDEELKESNEVIREPRNAQHWMLLGMIYDSNMDFGRARQCYEQAITLDPDCMTCWYHTAHIRFITSDYDGCIEAIKRVIQLQDNFTMAHWRLGYWLVYRGNINDAEVSFTRATRIDARDPAGWFGLAIVRMEQ